MSMFANAKTVKTGSKSKKAEKAEIQIEGLENLAAIDAVIKSLEALKKTVEADVKSQMMVHFVKTGCDQKKRPENFKGMDGDASASCELRARSSASGLSDSEIDLCKKHNIATEEVTAVVDTFIFNPAYANDGKLLGEIEKKLKGIKGLPEDLILKQDGSSKTVVAASAMDEVFLLQPEVAKQMLAVVGVLAVKPKLEGKEVADAFDIVKVLIGEEE